MSPENIIKAFHKTVRLHHRQVDVIELLGQRLVYLEVSGPTDKDNDGDPEFLVTLDVPGKAFDIKNRTIELPASSVAAGGIPLIGLVLGKLEDKGLDLPDGLAEFVSDLLGAPQP